MLVQDGSPLPLGATFDGQGVNFTLVAAAAEQVELCLFDHQDNEQCLALTARSGDTWHGYLPGIAVGQRYGFRVSGPFDANTGQRFNRHKLLIDPYARQLSGTISDDERLYDGGEQPSQVDSAAAIPKALVVDSSDYDWQGDQSPAIPWGQTLIYEAHVRGLTKMHPELPAELRGSYAALGHPLMIAYFKQLGITTLELLPIQQHADEPRLLARGLKNYWGYNTLAPYAVEPSYASGQPGISPLTELRDAVKALHQAGIEVILDVVFNHSGELDLTGPVLSWRGIDNASYYWLNQDGSYQDQTGCGNTLRLNSPNGVAWVLDCLRYWVREYHIDGFRFDLATVLGRTPVFSPDAPLLQAILNDSQLAGCKLIAEPWDIGSDGYQLGAFPSGFAEWNDHYRDDIRRFWLQGECSLGQFAQRFAASSSLFNREGRPPSASINQLTSHDGFTLRDLLCFNHKYNQFNGDNNRDGQNNNHSYNHGWEGLEGDESVQQRRQASQYALLASLLLSQGTPMLLAGDEQGNSQLGNNNAYCQDNFISWLDWSTADQALISFTAELIKLRQQIPALRQDSWWQEGDGNVQWLGADGQPLQGEQWQQGQQQVLQICLSQDWLLLINRGEQGYPVQLPVGHWQPCAPFTEANIDEGYLPARSFSVWKKN